MICVVAVVVVAFVAAWLEKMIEMQTSEKPQTTTTIATVVVVCKL